MNTSRSAVHYFGLITASLFVALYLECGELRAQSWPKETWETAEPAELGMDEALLRKARDYALSATGSGMVTRHGKQVIAWGDQQQKYDLKSTSKSVGVTALGLALGDGKIKLSDPAVKYQPQLGVPPEENKQTGWIDEITILHLATQTAGFEKPGGYEPLRFQPGTKWHYSDGGPNWLAECVTLAYGQDIESLMFERILTPIGVTHDDLHWRKHQYRDHMIDGIRRCEFGSGVHANVNAMARLGLLYLREGQWKGKQLLSKDFIEQARRPVDAVVGLEELDISHGNASDHYGLLWWNNADGTLANVPRDAYWSWGLYDSLIIVIPSLDIVATRTGRSWKRSEGANHYDVLQPFLDPIVASVQDRETADKAKPADTLHAASPVIKSITWSPVSTIIRKAEGSDNWPMTWGDDDAQYTAYGDGWGFVPKVDKKLSMGFAKIVGAPTDFQGINVRSDSGETIGQGPKGKKASGILMVDGVLYLLVRNADNSQLAWSNDHGTTWEWSDWKFTTSFGCPSFLNFGKNYAGARDDYVYLYSPESDSAYVAGDSLVMARVPKEKIRDRFAYEFYTGTDDSGQPTWIDNSDRRAAVFSNPGKCYRSNVTYNAGLKRYLLCQIFPESSHPKGQRFQGGFGIYDAPQPWGPWTKVFATDNWDTGPGESSSFPTKWMSEDGKTLHLVFSGDDFFSVRQAQLETRIGWHDPERNEVE